MSVAPNVQKDMAMIRQKELMAGHAQRLREAHAAGRKVVYTFVPGNLTELLLSFGVVPAYPEIHALQAGMRRASDGYIREAERIGHAEDVCSYVKSDVGMGLAGAVGEGRDQLPRPDLLLLSFTGCATFFKWFENLRGQYDAPIAMLQVPYQADGIITREMRDYVVKQIREEVIPALERLTGQPYDERRLCEHLRRSREAEDHLVAVLEAARSRPSPIDAYFGAVYYVGPIFSAFRGTEDAVAYYRALRDEVEERVRQGQGPITPEGPLARERFRLVAEGTPCWTSFRDMWKMFSDEGAVIVASTYSKVGGLYDTGFRHDPDRPLESLAEYCLGCYTNLSLPTRLDLLQRYMRDYDADGFVVHSVKSCKAFGAGQVLLLRELERRTGKPGCFLESDLVDSRYFSHAHFRNRLESYLQALALSRKGGAA
ncbi:MAG: benzoyl-CoA reductase subunit B [Acidobacteriota bacterium]